MTFYSLLDSDEGGAGLDEGEELKEEEEGQDTDPISVMQNHFQRTATSLKYKAREERERERERGGGNCEYMHVCIKLACYKYMLFTIIEASITLSRLSGWCRMRFSQDPES